MSVIMYDRVGNTLATARNADRPEVFLTWVTPSAEIGPLNVRAYYESNGWRAVTVGRNLDWHAFQVQCETIMGDIEHPRFDPMPCELRFDTRLMSARCLCGQWDTAGATADGTSVVINAWQAHCVTA